jgi:hypothetical protein
MINIEKADALEHSLVFERVGLLVNGPPGDRAALHLVIRLRTRQANGANERPKVLLSIRHPRGKANKLLIPLGICLVNLGDIRVIHQRQRLALGLEAGE